jgi:hypothetical protein
MPKMVVHVQGIRKGKDMNCMKGVKNHNAHLSKLSSREAADKIIGIAQAFFHWAAENDSALQPYGYRSGGAINQ